MFIASLGYLSDSNPTLLFYIYESQYLSNFIGCYKYYDDGFKSFTTNKKSLSVYCPSCDPGDIAIAVEFAYQIHELETKNCDSQNLFYSNSDILYPIKIGALDSGQCILSILVPDQLDSSSVYASPSLNLVNMTYKGDSSVKVMSLYDGQYYPILEFDEKSVDLFYNLFLYGQLFSFIIPPNGKFG